MELYTCYSPAGEKFELSRANYLDCTQHYGFSVSAPSDYVAPEVDEAGEGEGADEEAVTEDADEDAVDEDAVDEDAATDADDADADAPLTFADKDAVKTYLRDAGVDFDGRASFDDLVELANLNADTE